VSDAGATDQLLAVIQERGADPFLIDAHDGRTLSYRQAHDRACRLAGKLAARDLEPGSRVLVSLPNGVELALLYLAALYSGLTVIPLGPGFGVRELRSILARSRARWMLYVPGSFTRAVDLAREAGIELVCVGDWSAADTEADRSARREIIPFAHSSPDDVVAIHFTSGTTGAPRGVGHRLADFLGNARRLARATGVGPESRFHATLPMTYLGGYYNLLLLPLALGASVVIDRPFDGRMALDFWEVPIRRRVTVLWLVPTIMAMLLRMDRDERGARYCREHVRLVAAGMGPLNTRMREQFEEVYGVPVLENYGLAETLLAVSATQDRPPEAGACGSVLEDVRLRVVDEHGDELPALDPGVIEVATPDMMAGYLDATGSGFEQRLRDGRWLDTGDLGILGADGQLRITGRVKEVIVRGGLNISALAVEEALAGRVGVERLAVVGVPHPILGEDTAVVVTCEPGVTLADVEDDLRKTAQQCLDPAQQPGLYVQIDELPLTPSGKVRTQALRELVIDRFGLAPARS
jgi:acyl-coenzyme A synthetase/AMP-(fatty) acid ligase